MRNIANRASSTVRLLGAWFGLVAAGATHRRARGTRLESTLGRLTGTAGDVTAAELSEAIERGQLIAHYQPKVFVSGPRAGSVSGFEALARWRHPRLGLLPPEVFVPIAERSGLIDALTEAMLTRILSQLRSWRESGLDLDIALNVSSLSLDDAALPDRIVEKVTAAGIEPRRVTLEITESAGPVYSERALRVLARLHRDGFRLSVDDFGIGAFSLAQLYRAPFAELKIDKLFLVERQGRERARAVLRAVVGLAHDLSLTVCVEGVETLAAWSYVRSLGSEQAQGHYLSPALPAAEVEAWLAHWARRVSIAPQNPRVRQAGAGVFRS